MLVVLSIVFLVLALCTVPVGMALAISSLVVIAIWPVPGFLFAQKLINGMDSFPLLAIPFFILAAAFMNSGGITTRVIDLLSGVLWRVRGASGVVNVAANVFLAGVSGSAVADASASGAVLIPAMRREGYSGGFAAALTAGAAIVGPIIPPSIPLVIYGVIAQASILKLFVGAYVPGFMIALALTAYVIFVARRQGLPSQPLVTLSELGVRLRKSAWALSMPVMLAIGAKGGFFTVTELGAVLVIYAIFVGWVIYREFRWSGLPVTLSETALQTANIMLVVGASSFVAYLIVVNGIPNDIQELLTAGSIGRTEFLILVNVIFLIAGMFLDSTPATIILVPIFLPAAKALGIDPVHFGVVVVLNLMIGLIHPPIGLNLLITQTISKAPMTEVVLESLPILAIVLILLAIVTFVPGTVLWLPAHLGMA